MQEPPNIPLFEVQYFPPIAFFAIAVNYPAVLIEQYENYQKRGFRNKCHILASGGIEVLSIPLKKGKNQQQSITEVKIAYDKDWRKQHLSSVQTAYGKSPFYIHYIDSIKDVLYKDYEYLFELDVALINLVFKHLRLDTVLAYTETYKPIHDKYILDLRNKITPNNSQPADLTLKYIPYPQLFSDRLGFIPACSILDLLFCMGPDAVGVLGKMEVSYEL